jgi:S-adenosylmethionine synthetase
MTDGYLFTSESVSMGHPDKVCDAVSDAVVDALLATDPDARIACETFVTTGLVVLGGEITVHTDAARDALAGAEQIVRDTIRRIGYVGDLGMKFDADTCGILRVFHSQSADISRGVTADTSQSGEQGAGDQGLMFGYACRETPELMPLPIMLAHKLVERHAKVRTQGKIDQLRPDAKSQVTVRYDDAGKPQAIDTVVLSTQHGPKWSSDAKQKQLKNQVIEHIIEPVMPKKMFDPKAVTIHVNPTGQFEVGGPHGDVGLTGRKIIVDTYGGRGRHGGGAFSGKDPSKVDRSAAYMARHVAKNVVKAGLADVCEVQLSYAIGVNEPTSVHVDCFGTHKHDPRSIEQAIREVFPLTPRGIIEHLQLRAPIFTPTAAHGHFGRKPADIPHGDATHPGFTWERTEHVDHLKSAVR